MKCEIINATGAEMMSHGGGVDMKYKGKLTFRSLGGARIVPNPQRVDGSDALRVGTTRAPFASFPFLLALAGGRVLTLVNNPSARSL
jgi:hypothetical protein